MSDLQAFRDHARAMADPNPPRNDLGPWCKADRYLPIDHGRCAERAPEGLCGCDCHPWNAPTYQHPAPDNPIIRYAEMPDGPEFDEFIAKGADVHIEAMGDAQWWIGVQIGERMWHINVGAKSPRAKGYANCEEDS